MGWRAGRRERTKCVYILYYIRIYARANIIYIYFTYVYADKTPRPGGVDRTRGDDKAEGGSCISLEFCTQLRTDWPNDEKGWRRPRGFAGVGWLARIAAGGGVGGGAYRTFVCARLFPVPSRKRKTSHTCINVLKGSGCVCECIIFIYI